MLIDTLWALAQTQARRIKEQARQIDALNQRITSLEERLRTNSRYVERIMTVAGSCKLQGRRLRIAPDVRRGLSRLGTERSPARRRTIRAFRQNVYTRSRSSGKPLQWRMV